LQNDFRDRQREPLERDRHRDSRGARNLFADLFIRARISQKMFTQLFCKGHFPHKSVNLFFILVIMQDKVTDLWGS
jgi:hypothetical protein